MPDGASFPATIGCYLGINFDVVDAVTGGSASVDLEHNRLGASNLLGRRRSASRFPAHRRELLAEGRPTELGAGTFCAVEDATLDPLTGQFGEEALDALAPGRRGCVETNRPGLPPKQTSAAAPDYRLNGVDCVDFHVSARFLRAWLYRSVISSSTRLRSRLACRFVHSMSVAEIREALTDRGEARALGRVGAGGSLSSFQRNNSARTLAAACVSRRQAAAQCG